MSHDVHPGVAAVLSLTIAITAGAICVTRQGAKAETTAIPPIVKVGACLEIRTAIRRTVPPNVANIGWVKVEEIEGHWIRISVPPRSSNKGPFDVAPGWINVDGVVYLTTIECG